MGLAGGLVARLTFGHKTVLLDIVWTLTLTASHYPCASLAMCWGVAVDGSTPLCIICIRCH